MIQLQSFKIFKSSGSQPSNRPKMDDPCAARRLLRFSPGRKISRTAPYGGTRTVGSREVPGSQMASSIPECWNMLKQYRGIFALKIFMFRTLFCNICKWNCWRSRSNRHRGTPKSSICRWIFHYKPIETIHFEVSPWLENFHMLTHKCSIRFFAARLPLGAFRASPGAAPRGVSQRSRLHAAAGRDVTCQGDSSHVAGWLGWEKSGKVGFTT